MRARRSERALLDVEARLVQAEHRLEPALAKLPESSRLSARNLVHYVALRGLDLRELQLALSGLGLSSLGRAEADVLGSVRNVLSMLQRALGHGDRGVPEVAPSRTASLLRARAQALFGEGPAPAVMVTMPSSAAEDPAFVRGLLLAGMQVMRVNGAHDGPSALRAMVANLRSAERDTGKVCKVLVDLPGPKLRTLSIAPGPRVLKIKPEKDEFGRLRSPAQVRLRAVPATGPEREPEQGEIGVDRRFLEQLSAGDEIRLRDARGKRRRLEVLSTGSDQALCAAKRTTYVDAGCVLHAGGDKAPVRSRYVHLKAREAALRLRRGDALWLRGDQALGRAEREADGEGSGRPASIACGFPALIEALAPGHRVLFDDGKIECAVERVVEGRAALRVVRTRGVSAQLRAEKGINVPDTELRLPTLAEEDLTMLRAALELADMVALSFVRGPEDVRALYRELDGAASKLGVVLKIETERGFAELPSILLEALAREQVAVMIARGDLAVECGFERLAEVQEEILWLCEAAQVPVIWATQVLETLAKEGQPTRAEVTDAAMSERAECVMLNKGPYIAEALRSLNDILERMRGHQSKKRSMLRPLRSPRFSEPLEASPELTPTLSV